MLSFPGTSEVIKYLRFNLRSQIYAKSLPMAMTIGAIKRLEIIQTHPEYRERLWTIVRALQKGLRDAGLDLGKTESPVLVMLSDPAGVGQADTVQFAFQAHQAAVPGAP